MTLIRGSLKVLMFFLIITIFLIFSFTGQLFLRSSQRRRNYFTFLTSLTSRIGVWFLNVDLTVKNLPSKDKNYLFVCNHMGILDIICLDAIHPTLFITSVEMQQTPGLGLLCEMAGCLFVERRSRGNIHGEIGQIREALTQGLCVTLYPEGTSTNAEKILPFKKSLLTSAAGTGVPIMALVINYRMINGQPMADHNRDRVCWYGDMSFQKTFWNLLTNSRIVAEIEFIEEIDVHSDEQRREVSARCQRLIEERFTPIPKPSLV